MYSVLLLLGNQVFRTDRSAELKMEVPGLGPSQFCSIVENGRRALMSRFSYWSRGRDGELNE